MTRAALLVCVLAIAQEGDPAWEYRQRLEGAKKLTATKLISVGAFLSDKEQHASARLHYSRAAWFDPENEDARRRLGERRIEGGGWERDPGATVKTSNAPRKEEELLKLHADAAKRLADAEKAIGLEWTAIGNLAEKAGLKAESEAAWREAMQFYPGGESARKKLGYEKGKDGVWRLPSARTLREEVSGGVAKAPSGAEDTGKSVVGEKTGVTLARRSSEHFLIESSHLDQAALTDLVQRAEHCWAMFHKALGQQSLLKEKYTFVLFKDAAQYEKCIDEFHKGTAEQKAWSKKNQGHGSYPMHVARTGDRPISNPQDFVIHYPVQAMMAALAGPRALWLLEAAALWFTSEIMDTAVWACVAMASTGTGANARNLRDPKNWRIVLKSWLEEGKDPDIVAVMKCTTWAEFDGPEAVKAWSLFDFLLTEHRDKLIAFLADVRAQKDTGEASLAKVFGWPVAELDARWRTWARAATEGAK